MKPHLVVAITVFLLIACSALPVPTDENLLRFVWKNHPLPNQESISFEQFLKIIHWKRSALDVNRDGRNEILLSVTASTQNIGSFSIFSTRKQGLTELFFTQKSAWYDLEIDFEPRDNSILLRWLEKNGGSNVRTTDLHEEFIRCAGETCSSISYQRYSWITSFGPSEAVSSTSITITQPFMEGDMITLKSYAYQAGSNPHSQICYDANGTQWGISRIKPYTILGPETLTLYRWNGQSFDLLSRRETRPGMAISNENPLNRSLFENLLYVLHDRWYGGQIDKQQIEQDYRHFFDLQTASEPCGESSPLSLASIYWKDTGAEIVYTGQTCRLQIWHQPDWRSIHSMEDISIIERFDFPCQPASIRLLANDLNDDNQAEVWVSSTQSFQETIYFFQITPKFQKLGELSGFLREPNFHGIEWEERGENLIFYAGKPFWNESSCRASLSCYTSLEQAYDCFQWKPEENHFILCSVP